MNEFNKKFRMNHFSNGINHYIENTSVFPFEFTLLGIRDFKWENYYSCLGGKLIEYYLSVDFIEEIMRTFMHENLKIEKDIINRLLPFNYEHFDYFNTIIKNSESKDLKKAQEDTNVNVENKYENQTNSLNYSDHHIHSNTATKSINPEKKHVMDSKNVETSDPFEYNSNLNPYVMNKGSNNFVISGKHTKSGNPIFCNDPHLMNSIPSFWYISNMKIGNEYHFSGANHPGVPIYLIGSNGYISWGITNGFVDTNDVFKVKRTNNEGEFLLDGKIYKLTERKEKIYLDQKKEKFQEITVYECEYGTVINGFFNGFFMAFGKHPIEFTDQNQYYYIVRGNVVEENFLNGFFNFWLQKDSITFRNSLRDISISLNMVYIDVFSSFNLNKNFFGLVFLGLI